MNTAIISSTNYSGYTANITFNPLTGGTISLGSNSIPFLYTADYIYGDYSLYFSSWTTTCSSSILPPPVTIGITKPTPSNFTLQVSGTASQINWGDSTPIETVTDDTVTHTYSSSGNFTITFLPLTLTGLIVTNNDIDNITNLPNTLINLDVSNNNISSLYIENLLDLKVLNCNQNNLVYLNNQYNTNLEIANLNNNQLNAFNLAYNPQLKFLDVSYNNLVSMNLATNLTLESLSANNNSITSLIFNGGGMEYYYLNYFDISNNNLSSITFYTNSFDLLTTFKCDYNNLTIFNNLPTNITNLYCSNNSLSSLNISSFFNLTNLDCSSNNLTSLDNALTPLVNLNASYNNFDSSNLGTVLVNLYNSGIPNGEVSLVSQTPSACPSPEGYLAIDYLLAGGWVVQLDPTCNSNFVTLNFDSSFLEFTFDSSNTVDVAVDWMDGSPFELVSGAGSLYFTHTSGNNPSSAKIIFSDFSQINRLYSQFSTINSLAGLDYLNNLSEVYLDNSALSVSSVNDVLVTLSGNSVSNGTVDLSLQTPAACPTGNGITAKNYLINVLNWTVTVDTGC